MPTPSARRLAPALLAALCVSTSLAQEKTFPPMGSVERLNPRLDKLIPPGAKLERLAEGYDWSEGPVWIKKSGYLLFSDVPMNTVFRWDEKEGIRPFLKPSGYTGTTPRGGEPGSNGLTLDPDGRLVLCQHGDRRVSRLNDDGKTFTTIADKFEGKRFNSPNDAVFDKAGNLYFTDPPYGLVGNVNDPAKELPFSGVYRVSKDGKVALLTKELKFPNGIALSPDEQTLYVASSDGKNPVIMAYPRTDAGIGEGKVVLDGSKLANGRKGGFDGMKVDKDGNLFATGPGGVLVVAADGTHLGTILTGQATANCAWGDDGSTLYITADMYLCRIKTSTKGSGW